MGFSRWESFWYAVAWSSLGGFWVGLIGVVVGLLLGIEKMTHLWITLGAAGAGALAAGIYGYLGMRSPRRMLRTYTLMVVLFVLTALGWEVCRLLRALLA